MYPRVGSEPPMYPGVALEPPMYPREAPAPASRLCLIPARRDAFARAVSPSRSLRLSPAGARLMRRVRVESIPRRRALAKIAAILRREQALRHSPWLPVSIPHARLAGFPRSATGAASRSPRQRPAAPARSLRTSAAAAASVYSLPPAPRAAAARHACAVGRIFAGHRECKTWPICSSAAASASAPSDRRGSRVASASAGRRRHRVPVPARAEMP